MSKTPFLNASIRAVLFDFDGTLRHSDPASHHFIFEFAATLGAADTTENRRYASRWAHRYWNGKGEIIEDSERFGYNTPEFWKNYATKLMLAFNCSLDAATSYAPKINQHMTENYDPTNVLEPITLHLLNELRETGYVLGVVSNRDEPFTELLDELGLSEYFLFSLAAGEINSWKPEKEIFLHALEIAGTRPDETLYIGDNYFADVVGSRGAGLHPVLFDPETVFPEADCPVINSIEDLRSWLVPPITDE